MQHARVKGYVAWSGPGKLPGWQLASMSERSHIGQRIRTLREQGGLTQADLGAAIGTSRTHLTNIEGGKGNPGRELLVAIATHFGVSLDWLSEGSGEPRPTRTLDETEILLVQAFRRLPRDEREAHLNLMLKRLEHRGKDA